MIASLFFATLALQANNLVMPAGIRPEFQAEVLAIEGLMEKQQFDAAIARLAKMPTREVRISWNDASVPAGQRPSLSAARDQAFATWKQLIPNLDIQVVPSAPLSLTFSPRSELEQGLLLKGTPVQEAVISLSRGGSGRQANVFDVHNEIVRAIGAYLGVADSVFHGNSMRPVETMSTVRTSVMRQDADTALANLALLDNLRKMAGEKRMVKPVSSSIVVANDSLDLGKMVQGATKQFQIEVENRGTGPLEMWVKPDCGCMAVRERQSVPAGGKLAIPVSFDSREFSSDVVKHVVLVTNDPKQPTHMVTLKAGIAPYYRIIMPTGPVAVVGDAGGSNEFFVAFTDAEPFDILRMDYSGVKADVTYVPWEGMLADPELGVAAMKRRGYKFTVTYPANLPPGRSPGTVTLFTNALAAKQVIHTMYVQKGIVALPEEIFMGAVAEPKVFKTLISRPGKPFKVLRANSSSPHVTFKLTPAKGGEEYVLEISYDGKAPKGQLQSEIEINTDDPKQPKLVIPVAGTVR